MKISKLVFKVWIILTMAVALSCENNESEPIPEIPDPCEIDPCSNPPVCGCTNIFSELKKDDFKPEGVITETTDGFTVEGELSFESAAGPVVFEDANVSTNFDADNKLQGMSGTVKVPNLLNYFSFPNPVTADIGYFSGKYLNENRDFDIILIDSVSYFVFNFQLDVAVKFGNPNDPNTTPLTLSVPVGGHITLIMNYNDPFFYFSLGQDLLGGTRMGSSAQGFIPYVPLQPLDQFKGFYGKKLSGGTFSVFKFLTIDGSVIEYAEVISTTVSLSNPVPDNITADYKAGMNGEFTLSLPIKPKKAKIPFLELSMPIAEASAGITAVADVQAGVKGKAFINGVLGADNSWWPDFIPLSFGAERRAWGYLQQDGVFEIGNSGKFFFEIPGKKQSTEGSVVYTNEDITYTGVITENDLSWTAVALVEEASTTVTLDPPYDFTAGLSGRINATIEEDISDVIAKTQELENAEADYEFELSLRGLRKDLPAICNTASSELTTALNKAVSDARAAIDKEFANADVPLVRCDDNLHTVIFNAASPYFAAITRLKNAANASNDDATTRKEIEGALRNLIALKKINKTVSGSVKSGTKFAGCTFAAWGSRNRTIAIQVIGEGTVAKLQEAADHVQYIASTSNTVVTLQEVINQLPLKEDLEKLKNDLQTGVKQIPTIDNMGYVKTHNPARFTFFATLNGKREEVAEFNVFSGESVLDFIVGTLK